MKEEEIKNLIQGLDPLEDALLIGLLEEKISFLKASKPFYYPLFTYGEVANIKRGLRKHLNNELPGNSKRIEEILSDEKYSHMIMVKGMINKLTTKLAPYKYQLTKQR